MTVIYASNLRSGGGMPKFDKSCLRTIEDNIRRYLLEYGRFNEKYK